MTMPDAPPLAVPELRGILGLPAERPLGVRDLIAVPGNGTDAIPGDPALFPPVVLALGDWPERWRDVPESGPEFLVTLRGDTNPYRIADIWKTNPGSWGLDQDADPGHRTVPLLSLAYVTSATLAGRILDTGFTFGWLNPEEQFAFL